LEADLKAAPSHGQHEISLFDPLIRQPYLRTAGLQDSRHLGVNVPRRENALGTMLGMNSFQKLKRHGNSLKSWQQEIVFLVAKFMT
jgi:hypothetical protein